MSRMMDVLELKICRTAKSLGIGRNTYQGYDLGSSLLLILL